MAAVTLPMVPPPYFQEHVPNEYNACAMGGPYPVLVRGLQGGSDVNWRSRSRHSGGSSGAAGARPKRRFCTYYPETSMCRRGATCAFAHSREEIAAPLLEVDEEQKDPGALTDAFFMYKYKTLWCPIGVQHEWHVCPYAHNYQDARRSPKIGYGAKVCPYWSKKDTGAEYSQRCPLGLRCPYSHGAKEQLYHPHYFKTVTCRDLHGKVCPRMQLCAFFHHRNERRSVPNDQVDYSHPLTSEELPQDWVDDFLNPPFLPESGGRTGNGGFGGEDRDFYSDSTSDGQGAERGALVGPGAGPNRRMGMVPYAQQMAGGPPGGGSFGPMHNMAGDMGDGCSGHMSGYGQTLFSGGSPNQPCVFLMPFNGLMQPTATAGSQALSPQSQQQQQQQQTGDVQSPMTCGTPMATMPQNWAFVPMDGGNQCAYYAVPQMH